MDRAPKKANIEIDKQTIPAIFFVFCSLFFLDIKTNPKISRKIAEMKLIAIKKGAVSLRKSIILQNKLIAIPPILYLKRSSTQKYLLPTV